MSQEIRIQAVKTSISMREKLLQLHEENDSQVGSNMRKLKELNKTLVQLECEHITQRFAATRAVISNAYCPKCGRCLMAGE